MKPPYLIKFLFLFLIGMSFHSIHSSAQETKNISVANFSAVQVSTGIEVILIPGTKEGAKVVADEGVIDEVEVTSVDSKLNIRFRENTSLTNRWKNKNAKVYVTYKSLNGVAASSGSSIESDKTLKTDHLNAKVSSGASLKLAVQCAELQVQISSGASADLTGTATNADVKSSSGSSVHAEGLHTDYAKIVSSSGADVRLTVNKGLETTASSGSSIRYKGNASLKNNSSKRADVRKID